MWMAWLAQYQQKSPCEKPSQRPFLRGLQEVKRRRSRRRKTVPPPQRPFNATDRVWRRRPRPLIALPIIPTISAQNDLLFRESRPSAQ